MLDPARSESESYFEIGTRQDSDPNLILKLGSEFNHFNNWWTKLSLGYHALVRLCYIFKDRFVWVDL